MRIIATTILAALLLAGAPAFAQAVMLNFSFSEMRQQMVDLKSTVKKEAVTDEGVRFLEAETESGLIYAIYGLECDNKEATQRCRGAEMVVSFKFADGKKVSEALTEIDYAALADYEGADGRLKLSRYVIFDNGITAANLKVNLEVFLNISDDVWDFLDEEGYLG